MAKEVRHAIANAEDDKNVFGIVITGAGKAFCAGADMVELQKLGAEGGFSKSDKESDAWIPPKLVGLNTTFDILWSSRKIYGKEAKEMKLATRVYPMKTL